MARLLTITPMTGNTRDGVVGIVLSAVLVAAAFCPRAAAQQYPTRSVEIHADHPLLLFRVSGLPTADPAAFGQQVIRVWNELPENLRPYSVLIIDMDGPDVASRHQRYRDALQPLQDSGVPVAIQMADENPRNTYPIALAEELLRDFVCVKGIDATGLAFDEYHESGPDAELATPPNVRWLVNATGLAAGYGRFITIQLGGLNWPRLMSNVACRPLYEKFRECAPYVIPVALHRGEHNVARMTSVMGLWVEGAAEHWGVGATSMWYSDARFIEPGVFGVTDTPANMPPCLYRAMILNGAMTGATVYSFDLGRDLWFGESRRYWDSTIRPTLEEIIERGFIAKKEFVQEKAKVAYQLEPSSTPADFHLNLRDIDSVIDSGLLIHGAYGMESPGLVPELILNSGRHYWVPIISAHGGARAAGAFARILQAGAVTSAQDWTDILDRHYAPDGFGPAFICKIGRGVFIMNSRENSIETQSFSVPNMPSPVRNIEARNDQAGTLLTWPLREGDVGYRVYRRILPDGAFSVVAQDVDEPRWLDTTPPPDTPVAYAVTALTNESELYEGTLRYGEYLALSTVESRIEEQVMMRPGLGSTKSHAIGAAWDAPATQVAPDSLFADVPEERLPIAKSVVETIDKLAAAFALENLDSVVECYKDNYEDQEGWRLQYVRRAYQWFFERYRACRMDRQVRQWDFEEFDQSRKVRVKVYCRFSGVAVSDPSGRFADPVAFFPRADRGEIWLTLADQDGTWRIAETDPALPNMKDILSFSTGPYDGFVAGPDRFAP